MKRTIRGIIDIDVEYSSDEDGIQIEKIDEVFVTFAKNGMRNWMMLTGGGIENFILDHGQVEARIKYEEEKEWQDVLSERAKRQYDEMAAE